MARDWFKLSMGFTRNGRLAEACAEGVEPAAVYLTLLTLNQEFGTDGVVPISKVENPARIRAAGSAVLGSMDMEQIGRAMELLGAAGLISTVDGGVRINGYGPEHMPPCSQCHGPNPTTASRCPKCAAKRRKNGPAMEQPRQGHGPTMDPREERRGEERRSEEGGKGSLSTVPEPGTTDSLYDELVRTAETIGVHEAEVVARSFEEQGGTVADLEELAQIVHGDDPIDPSVRALVQTAVESLVDGVFELSDDESAGATRIADVHGQEALLDLVEYFAAKRPAEIAQLTRRICVETPDVIRATVEVAEKASSGPRTALEGVKGSDETLIDTEPVYGE